jgi:hypothetical protein
MSAELFAPALSHVLFKRVKLQNPGSRGAREAADAQLSPARRPIQVTIPEQSLVNRS